MFIELKQLFKKMNDFKKNVISNVTYTHIPFYDMSKKLFPMGFANQKNNLNCFKCYIN